MTRSTGKSYEESLDWLVETLVTPGLQRDLALAFMTARAEGLEKGELLGRQAGLRHQLELKFGVVPDEALARLARADVANLERWAGRILTATTLDDALA